MNKSTIITGMTAGGFLVGLLCGEKSLINRARRFHNKEKLLKTIEIANAGVLNLEGVIRGISYPTLHEKSPDKYDALLSDYIDYLTELECIQTKIDLFKISNTNAINALNEMINEINEILVELSKYMKKKER